MFASIASLFLAMGLGGLLLLVAADCECGYATSSGLVFANLFESDFAHVNYLDGDKGWAPQAFNRTAAAARGKYGQSFTTANVLSSTKGAGDGDGDADTAGLHLVVNSELVDGAVRNGEMASTDSFFYGSYRIGMKVTDVAGTCSAFFWVRGPGLCWLRGRHVTDRQDGQYANDTQEIDIEFLSHEFNRDNQTFPVNLVLQTVQSMDSGYDASKTGTFVKKNLAFDPTEGVHEYRFDFARRGVSFYADGELLATMDGAGVPVTAGHLLLSHWSNGNPKWSHGPPARDAQTVVTYVKAYYNATDEARAGEHENCAARRQASPTGAVCNIPDDNAAFFFSNPKDNATLTGGHGNAAAAAAGGWRFFGLAVALGTMGWLSA